MIAPGGEVLPENQARVFEVLMSPQLLLLYAEPNSAAYAERRALMRRRHWQSEKRGRKHLVMGRNACLEGLSGGWRWCRV